LDVDDLRGMPSGVAEHAEIETAEASVRETSARRQSFTKLSMKTSEASASS
jgi:hypothetical protein